MAKRIAIAGWFGSENFGDELLLHAVGEQLRKADAAVELVVFCSDPALVKARHGYRAVSLPTRRAGARGLLEAIAQLRAGDLLVLGPGTIFQERSDVFRWLGTIPMLLRLTIVSRLCGTPVIVLGAAVREGTTLVGRRALRLLAFLSKSVSVRDIRSASELGPRARVVGDVAVAIRGPEPRSGGRQFAVSMRPLAPTVEPQLGQTLARLAATLILEEGLTGRFLPLALGHNAAGENDLDVYERYFRDVVPCEMSHFAPGQFSESVAHLFALMSELELVVATRLHAAISAVICGVPTIALSYERKVRETFETWGLDEYVLDVDADLEVVREACAAARTERGRRDFASARQAALAQGDVIRRIIEGLATS